KMIFSFLRKTLDHLGPAFIGRAFSMGQTPGPAWDTWDSQKKGGSSMNTRFAGLEKKYGDPDLYLTGHNTEPGQQESPDREPASENPDRPAWEKHGIISKLFFLLRAYHDQGISVRRTGDNYPVITVGQPDPGAPKVNREDLTDYAVHLFQEARPDLETFINSGELTVPAYPWLTREDFI
ncbi:MAG: hypothetical protein MI863_10270, partial [Desulfobacterales bacterium]|nr:hypothetical protein [Desulfobacterales bacterium]